MVKQYRYFACDFETTVYEGQEYTEVWAAVRVELYTEDVHITSSIDGFFKDIRKEKGNLCLYFHNLKFDGHFILDYFMRKGGPKRACIQHSEKFSDITWMKDRDMPNNTYKYSISDKGQWYMISWRIDGRIIEIRDSLKLMPMSLKRLGKSFKTKHKKLDMEYTGFRYAGCPRTPEEDAYITNDGLVLKEALEHMFDEGHNKLTIGSCCYSEFKNQWTKQQWEDMFPNVYELWFNDSSYGTDNVGDYVKASYKGGWCYYVPEKSKRILGSGVTADVNSLYPYVMHSASGSRYPIGMPTFWKGDYIPDIAKDPHKVFIIRFKSMFHVKHGHLPTLQIKRDMLYRGNEWLTSSDVRDPDTGEYTPYVDWGDGPDLHKPTITMTSVDYQLFRDHYDVEGLEILDGCYFSAISGIFDEYIDKYKKIKVSSTGAIREIAKLFSNNLYGKMASNTDSSFKVAYLKEDGSIGFVGQEEHDKTPGYIPIGTFITAYARNYTIRHAQKNYHGPHAPGFCYADTDSIHCDIAPDQLIDIHSDPTEYGAWKLEALWDKAIFVRQKTYIEHVTHENLSPVHPYHNIKCAGMPDRCKELLKISLDGYHPYIGDTYTADQIEFIKTKRDYKDFGPQMAAIPGKLIPKRIKGGVVLTETPYKMRDGLFF